MKLKLLFTGSQGALGRSIFSSSEFVYLNNMFHIVRWDTKKHGSLTDSDLVAGSMKSIDPDVVVHLAWLSTNTAHYEFEPANRDWAEATRSLASVTADLGGWFIGMGSIIEEYPNVASPYRESKIMARTGILETTPSATWLRPAWLLNPHVGRPRLIGDYLRSRRKNEPFTLSNPLTRHDFMHIADFPSALTLVLTAKLTGVQDVGMGIAHTVLDALESVDPHAKEHLIMEKDENESAPAEYLSNIDRLSTLGWKPTESIRIFGEKILPE